MRRLRVVATLLGCTSPPARVITIGDNVASNPTFRTSFVGLLTKNDDALFPDFAGRSFASLYGEDVEVVRLDRGGDSWKSVASADRPYCTCAGDACGAEPCIDTKERAQTTVIVELGGNDLLSGFLRLASDGALRSDPSPLLGRMREDARKVLALLRSPELFPVPPERVLVFDAYDPSDGVGDVAAIAARILPPNFGVDTSSVTPALGLEILSKYNANLAAEIAAAGATRVEAHAHFLGHGYHHADPANPNHDAADPTPWLRGAFDPTLRGAHELRRLVWTALSGEAISAIPKDLPPPSLLDLPPVPANGWAKAVASSKITAEIYSPALEVNWPNTLADPEKALGPPTGGADDAVAVGVLGAFLVVDLGADTVAKDGPGDDLVILEFGAISGGVPEPYRVLVSNAASGPFIPIADARGERAFDLAETGLPSARYVRIESLATTVDVLGGLGSPTAPGPEIDAIGAVHPGAP